jgi:hypothetical protein
MQRKIRFAALISMFLSAPAGAQQALHCGGLDPTAAGDATRAFECVSKLSAGLEEALARIASLEADAHKVPEKQLVPKGAVLAFDTPDACPEGWSPFVEGQSRFILGASFGLPNDLFRAEALTDRKYRDHDGEEMVTLTEAQMPAHAHKGSTTDATWVRTTSGPDAASFNRENNSGQGVEKKNRIPLIIASEGSDQPHPNMPPYIALYFCKKD